MPLEMKYFVLKPKSKDTNDIYARASRQAMRSYADTIISKDPVLAAQLRKWAEQEFQAVLEMDEENITTPTEGEQDA